MPKVKPLRSRSGPVKNQYIILDGDKEYFQSYDSIIVKIDHSVKLKGTNKSQVYLDINTWNYSRTTSKYRTQFLGEGTETTKAKIASGEYLLVDLN